MNIRKTAALALMTGIFAVAAFACTPAPASPAPSVEATATILPALPPTTLPIPIPTQVPTSTPVPPTVVPPATTVPESASMVTGTVTYRERIALSPDAVIEVKLLDVSRPGAPAVTLGEHIMENPGSVPIDFEIEYDPSEIDDRFIYAVRATITEGGELSFTTTSTYPVITRDNPNTVDLVLEKVASQQPQESGSVTGTVTYRERIGLSPDAVVEVKLLDVSRPGAPAVTLGEQIIESPGQVPVEFEISYNPDDIDERFSYAVRATITEGGELSFTTTSTYPVITRGNSNNVDLVLEKVASQQPQESANVTGTVTYRERIALRPDAVVQIQLADVSRADAPAIVLGEQVIENPGQVPIAFEIEYDPSEIDDRFTYAVQARITEGGELSFINTSRYAVLTRGNPDHIDLVLEKVGSSETLESTPTPATPEMVSVPAPVQQSEVKVSDSDPRVYSLSVISIQPRGSSCSDFEGFTVERDGTEINVSITNLEVTGVMMPCTADLPSNISEIPLGSEFDAGETYNVIINGKLTNSFVARGEEVYQMAEALSPIEQVEIGVPESESAGYSAIVISRLPRGSSCSKFNGYDVTHRFANTIEITLTHLEVTEQNVPCTLDLPVVQTEVPLGNDFISGETYTVIVNDDVTETFVAE